jgi:aminoglycoside/choline kinase family phosphotransferase
MSDAHTALPARDSDRMQQRAAFLSRAGYAGRPLQALPADASRRRYFRLVGADLLLMDSPPDSEPLGPYVQVARYLRRRGLSAPVLLEVDEAAGLALIEDFGQDTYTRLLAAGHEEAPLYRLAVDALLTLHRAPLQTSEALPAYDAARLSDEYALFIDWYVPLLIGEDPARALRAPYMKLFAQALKEVAERRETLVLRDFHVDNLMLLKGRSGVAACGLLDFQDALVGACAYDLMSLLEDARRDVPGKLREALLNQYLVQRTEIDALQFLGDYQRLAAQRHAKVLGIFVRLAVRDGKPLYLRHLPRVLGLFERALDGEAMRPLREFLDQQVPGWRDGVPAPVLARLA